MGVEGVVVVVGYGRVLDVEEVVRSVGVVEVVVDADAVVGDGGVHEVECVMGVPVGGVVVAVGVLVEALLPFVHTVREGRKADETGLDPKTQAPFMGVLIDSTEEGERKIDKMNLEKMAALTVEMVGHIAQEIRAVDFWRNIMAQNMLRGWIVRYLDDNDIVKFEKLERVADQLMDLAKTKHGQLVT